MFVTLHTGAKLREKVDTVKAPILASLLLPFFGVSVISFYKKKTNNERFTNTKLTLCMS